LAIEPNRRKGSGPRSAREAEEPSECVEEISGFGPRKWCAVTAPQAADVCDLKPTLRSQAGIDVLGIMALVQMDDPVVDCERETASPYGLDRA
jgi:hypothetical protein